MEPAHADAAGLEAGFLEKVHVLGAPILVLEVAVSRLDPVGAAAGEERQRRLTQEQGRSARSRQLEDDLGQPPGSAAW